MKHPLPLISVIIPVYNGERYLAEALESVLAQVYRPLEVVVVDDGSTDASAQVVKRFGESVTYLYQAQQGASVARNRGVVWSRGEFLAFLDADDLWVGDKLQRQMQMLLTDSALAMVFGQVEQFYSPELIDPIAHPSLGTRQTLAGLHVGAMLIRRSAFERVGNFAPAWQVAHFLEWYNRAQALGLQSLVLPEVVMKRRIHTTNLGIRAHDLARREYLLLAKTRLTEQAQARSATRS